ncbi:hypothetical protein SB775_25720 [Peribacillus sp. SIMBA_075]|uniref:hypothetical protein n=1 Tax=Peribacillus sp. SIMBA_075 TaxID=3085813 RepID=UPI003977EDC0
MDRKEIKQTLIVIGLIMVFFPLFINGLMFFRIWPVAGDVNTWISFLGTFWGAVIGGVIAGVLTLVGVRMTIKNQFIKEFSEKLPEQLMNLEDVIAVIKKQNSVLNMNEYIDNPQIIRGIMQKTIEILKVDGLLKKTTTVNLQTYTAVRQLNDYLNDSLYPLKSSLYTETEVKKMFKKCLETLNAEHSLMMKDIQRYENKAK